MSNPESQTIDETVVSSVKDTTYNVVHEETYETVDGSVPGVITEVKEYTIKTEGIIKEICPQTNDNVVPEVVSESAEQISKDIPPPVAAAVETVPPPSSAPAPAASPYVQVIYKSPDVKFEDDPTRFVRVRVESLIYWEHPKKSAIVFLSLLSTLILTQYYSVLQLLAGLFTIVTGLNWIYVNVHKQGQRYISGKTYETVVHPHSSRLEVKTTFTSRDRVVHAAELTLDVVETLIRQITKLVLIEDNKRSAIAVGIAYFIWTLAKYVSTKTLVGFFIVTAFTTPRIYLQHQKVIDTHVARHSQRAYALAQQYGQLANEKAQVYYGQAVRAIMKGTAKKAD
ncbi:hypothetical protein EC973_000881 [Apophysomyces ossiformis]|uniref:Reticulon-like protein n=1 Tax=Apophysomyces ossiformis TaxID=679940 RepID=A0A8H7BL29_9FUNG|nr:hypothetical protein EC973_000881 [Apophysomyces ossiformis]